MGMEIQVDSLEDMCSLMCDNVIPEGRRRMTREDVISRQAVLDYIDKMPSELTADGRRMIRRRTLEEYISDTLPSVTQEPKTGHWITKDGKEQGYDIGGIKTWYIQIMCDKCGFIKTAIEGHTGQYKYCPNCGARMESEVRNE